MKNTQAAKESIITRSDKVILKLSAISAIKPGDQWSTADAEPQRPGFSTSASRTVKNIWHVHETRSLNISDIEETINTAFRVLADIDSVKHNDNISSDDTLLYDKIIVDIKSGLLNSRDGICNLKVTYHNDEMAKPLLQKIIDSITKRYTKAEESAS